MGWWRGRKRLTIIDTRAFLWEVVWTKRLSFGEKTNIMEARKELYILLGEDVMSDSRGEEQVYMRGKKITFFRVMKEKTFTNVFGGKQTIYVVDICKRAIYMVDREPFSIHREGKWAIYWVDGKTFSSRGKASGPSTWWTESTSPYRGKASGK